MIVLLVPADLDQQAKRQQPLQPAGQLCRTQLEACSPADCIERDPVNGGVGKHVQRIADQPGRLSDQPGHQFEDEHDGVDRQKDFQRGCFLLLGVAGKYVRRAFGCMGPCQPGTQAQGLQSFTERIDTAIMGYGQRPVG